LVLSLPLSSFSVPLPGLKSAQLNTVASLAVRQWMHGSTASLISLPKEGRKKYPDWKHSYCYSLAPAYGF